MTTHPTSREPTYRSDPRELRSFLRRAGAFVLLGLVLYGILYVAAESLVRRYAERNRFHVIQQSVGEEQDVVILGASHAAVFDYRDMNARLEEMTGARVINLATVGGGITLNRLLLDYFFARNHADAVVYVVDSFAFYSPAWNEDRMGDVELYRRAPWDAGLAALLLREPAARQAALGYISGFVKINDSSRFDPDLFEAEGTRFDRSYRPIAQIDRQRIEFLYPPEVREASLEESPYLAEFERMIEDVQAAGRRFIVVRPPIPERIREMLPNEATFDAKLREVLARHGVELYDFTSVANDPELFYDSDHLNRDGVLNFYEQHFADVIRRAAGKPTGPLEPASRPRRGAGEAAAGPGGDDPSVTVETSDE